MSLKKKLQDLAEAVVCGPDEEAAIAQEIRKAQEEAAKKEGKQ